MYLNDLLYNLLMFINDTDLINILLAIIALLLFFNLGEKPWGCLMILALCGLIFLLNPLLFLLSLSILILASG
jgi:hypothetical protein